VGEVDTDDRKITFKNGCTTVGPIMKELRETLVDIQQGDREAPEGWIYKID
jgi:branched-chain amino acid aminotransferase